MKNNILLFSISLILSACASNPTKEAPTPFSTSNNQMIEINSNQQLFVEVTIENEKVTQLTPVTEIKNPQITLTLNFEPLDKGMLLTVDNPFPQDIKYSIDMIDKKGNPYKTSSCPVIAGGSVFENWSHPIPKLQITNLHFLKKNERIGCIY